MRALILDDYRRLSVHEVAEPEPSPTEVLVEIAAVGICGTDVHGFIGANGRRIPGQLMGHEASGRVVAVGSAVDDVLALSPGDPVVLNPLVGCGRCFACRRGQPQRCPDRLSIGSTATLPGAFAERMVIPVRNAVPLPRTLPLASGALIEPLAVAVHALTRVPIAPGDLVLIIGGGPIGQSAILAASAYSPERIVVSELTVDRRVVCSLLGADVVDPAAGPLERQVSALAGRPADVTIDAVGSNRSVAEALPATALGGTVVLVGLAAPRLDLLAYELSTAERSIVGSYCYSEEDFRAAVRLAAEDPRRLEALIAAEIGLDEAPAAFEALAGAHPPPAKILVHPG